MGNKYRTIIQQSIKKQNDSVLLPHIFKLPKKPTEFCKYDQHLSSSIIIISSKQNQQKKMREKHSSNINTQIVNKIRNGSIKEITKMNQSAFMCIGLILSECWDNQQQFMVYGTGTLIHNNIILTSAQNVYNRRLKKEYKNIKFLPGLKQNRHSGIYNVKRVYYPFQYTQNNYRKYNFALLQLDDDLSQKYGYAGWMTEYKLKDETVYSYGYTENNRYGSFKFYETKSQCKIKGKNIQYDQFDVKYSSTGSLLVIKDQRGYYVIGINNQSQKNNQGIYLTEEIRDTINSWTIKISLDLNYRFLGSSICEHLIAQNYDKLTQINLSRNNIDAQGCKFLKVGNWPHLTVLNLFGNMIRMEGCKQLRDSKWIHLMAIDLSMNDIGNKGCKYLKDINWPNLNIIQLSIVQFCLAYNNISCEGCKYLTESNWKQLKSINLCIYLLTQVTNDIKDQGCKFLKNANWQRLKNINLSVNSYSDLGCKYLKDVYWTQNLKSFFLSKKQISQPYQVMLKELWSHSNLNF